jgi:hypothetical protein
MLEQRAAEETEAPVIRTIARLPGLQCLLTRESDNIPLPTLAAYNTKCQVFAIRDRAGIRPRKAGLVMNTIEKR